MFVLSNDPQKWSDPDPNPFFGSDHDLIRSGSNHDQIILRILIQYYIAKKFHNIRVKADHLFYYVGNSEKT